MIPIIGVEKARRLWRAYQLEDAGGRRDLEVALLLKFESISGVDPLSVERHLGVPVEGEVEGDYELGTVVGGKTICPFGLTEDEFIQHVAIFGRSGAGKTNTVALLIKQWVARKKPFMIFDWKRNYRDLLASPNAVPLEVYTVGRDIRPLHFNPLIPPPGTDVKVWLKKLIEIISHAYYLGEGVMFMLQEALDQVYEESGAYEERPDKRYPLMTTVLDHLQKIQVKGRRAMWLDSTLRAVQSLCFGQVSNVINAESSDSILELLDKNVCLELNALGHSEKVFLIETLMVWVHHARMLENDRETFKHGIIIEEAHNILSPSGKETVIDTMLREVRELGEAIVLVDQHPSQISVPALGNTYCTIALNMKHSKDISALAEIMQVERENREIFNILPMGRALVKLQSRYMKPFQIQIPKVTIAKGSISDAQLAQMHVGGSTDSTGLRSPIAHAKAKEGIPSLRKEANKSPKTLISEQERRLMEDIRDYPTDGVVRRYARLEVSRRRGNHAKQSLIAKGVIEPVDVMTSSGKVVLLDFTQAMKAAFRRNEVSLPSPRRGGIVHLYWINYIAQQMKQRSWKVQIEAGLGKGEACDLVVSKGDQRVAIEIEAGKRGAQNVERLLSHGFDCHGRCEKG